MKRVVLLMALWAGTKCDINYIVERALLLNLVDLKENVASPTVNFTTKCFPEYGCYYNGPPFYDPVIRNASPPPADNPAEKIHFLLYTPINPNDNYTLFKTKESLQNSPFNEHSKTVVYIHGWLNQIKEDDLLLGIVKALVNRRGYNVILVHWIEYMGDSYEEAVANARVVGTSTALLIKFLCKETSLTSNDFHVIGHSLGGHVAAYVGQEVDGLLGRITSLDTSGPGFYSKSLEVRLDPSDAKFVDVIHTNAGYDLSEGFGMLESHGHQDFYPNGGMIQPNCEHENSIVKEKAEKDILLTYLLHLCDHRRAEELFLESIVNDNCTFRGTSCDSYENWKVGKCKSSYDYQVSTMGIDAKPLANHPMFTKFYLETSLKYPYCKNNDYENMTY